MTIGLFSTAISGIHAAQIGLQTTEHNINNQNTPGFNRQRNIQTTNLAMRTGAGFIGQGASVSTIERIYDGFLNGQINRAQTASSELGAYYDRIVEIDNMLADPKAGLSPALQDFFTGLSQVAANPAQLPARQAMLSSAQALVSRYQGLESRLNQMYDGVNSRLATQVGTVNAYALKIGELNQTIIMAQSSVNQPPNDLLDQRDQMVAELNKLIQITTTTNSDGSFNVFFGTGQQLVVGTLVTTMTALPSMADSTRFTIGLDAGGGVQELPESLIVGGSLGGLLKFRNETLDRVANDLGRNAASLALTFNAQYQLGQDLLGHKAGDADFVGEFFKISTPVVMAHSRNNSATAAVVTASLAPPSIDGVYTLTRDAADTLFTLTRQSDGAQWSGADLATLQGNIPAAENVTVTGAAVAAGASTSLFNPSASGSNYYTKLGTSDYRLDFDGSRLTVTRLSDNKAWTDTSMDALSARLKSEEGFSIALRSGALTKNDSFIIKPTSELARNLTLNPNMASDVRLLNAAMPFRTSASTSNGGTGKISAGEAIHGFTAGSVPAAGITLTYNGASGELELNGLPAGANISVTQGGTTRLFAGPQITYAAGAQISFAGLSFTISGKLNHGDTFTLTPNTAGVSDSRNAMALGKMQTQNTLAGKTATYQMSYAQLVSDVGNKTREISVTQDAQKALLKQSTAARESLSGVNLDEEAANLVRYQQAYQASAKALQIGAGLFETLLGIVR